MTQLNKYVPSVEKNQECLVESIGERVHLKKAEEHCLLFGGDQLTAVRARSAQLNVMNSDDDHQKLLGLTPVVEDWHTKMNLYSVS